VEAREGVEVVVEEGGVLLSLSEKRRGGAATVSCFLRWKLVEVTEGVEVSAKEAGVLFGLLVSSSGSASFHRYVLFGLLVSSSGSASLHECVLVSSTIFSHVFFV
jgi:hypothetical protein